MTAVFRSSRRWLLVLGVGGVLLFAALVVLRRPLLAAAMVSSLERAGAGEVRLDVKHASPWFVEVENLAFRFQAQRFDAGRVTIDRAHWWQPSLGTVRVEGVRIPVTVDASDTNPWAWTTYSGRGAAAAPSAPPVPLDHVTIDGVVVLKAAGQNAQELRVQFEARLGENQQWSGRVDATAPGLELQVEGDFDLPRTALNFRVLRAELELKAWEGFIQQMVLLPGGRWELAGRLGATATGSYTDGKFAAQGRVQLTDGRFVYPEKNVTATGVQADFTFTDFDQVRSEPGIVRVAELRAGEILATEVEFELAFEGTEKIVVHRAMLRAFGGRLSAEPFRFFPRSDELEATFVVDGIAVEQVLALAKDVPAKATGLVDGRVPVRIDGSGVRFGSGWLELKRGVYAEVQFNAAGLLTRNVAPSHPSYSTLQRVESGLLRLQLSELRLDIRPPRAPAGRSATLRLAGEPVDREIKAPVSLDLNVNGPLERLLNLGLDSRIRFGGGI